MATHWTLPQKDLFEPSPVSRLTETERREALDLLQVEAMNRAPEKAPENRAEARDDEDIA